MFSNLVPQFCPTTQRQVVQDALKYCKTLKLSESFLPDVKKSNDY